jgi:aldehyde reductase
MVLPTVKLNDGTDCPLVGLGTWQSPKGQVYQAVIDAIDAGYRHIDCAFVYGNEEEVGQAIKDSITSGKVSRADMFIVTKLWNTFHSRERVETAIKLSLEKLKLDYIDLYLIHWPVSFADDDTNLYPDSSEQGNVALKTAPDSLKQTWEGMEDVKEKGLAKSIGVSNFNEAQVENILSFCKVKPVMNQIERHPFLQQDKLLAVMKKMDIIVTAYSPLGSSPLDYGRRPSHASIQEERPSLRDNPVIKRIAEKHKKSTAQVLIRFNVQEGVVCIPKSVTRDRIRENIQVFDFDLDADDVESLKELDSGYRFCRFNKRGIDSHPEYPFVRVERF